MARIVVPDRRTEPLAEHASEHAWFDLETLAFARTAGVSVLSARQTRWTRTMRWARSRERALTRRLLSYRHASVLELPVRAVTVESLCE
jgi:hypothetical protein